MRPHKLLVLSTLMFVNLVGAITVSAQINAVPHLEKRGPATQLLVDGKPFLMLAGELHNSSSSSLEYMKPIWPNLAAMSINTVLTPISWELVEPAEGQYDFSLMDGLLAQAREQHLHLVLLWLAAWKNGMSSYQPVWVKQDERRFPRVVLHGNKASVLSSIDGFSKATREADSRAFASVMRHLKEIDSRDHTVLMMQVENEVGILGDSRDHSPEADRAFSGAIPQDLSRYLVTHRDTLNSELRDLWTMNGAKTSGTWGEVFGESARADEIFMAWNYARYVQTVTAAGKAAYNLPMYVNAWLGGGDATPGEYPSGGPQPRVIDIWKAAGSALDIYAPDLYQSNFYDWAKQYHRSDNPLLLPETNGGSAGAANVFYAVGEHAAIGFSPFAIDAAFAPAAKNTKEPALITMIQGTADLGISYAALAPLAPMILDQQTRGNVHGFTLTKEHPAVEFNMGGYTVHVSLDEIFGYHSETGFGLVLLSAPDEFIGVGKGFRVVITPRAPGKHVAIGSIVDGKFEAGKWIPERQLNGDENDQGAYWRFDPRAIHTEKVNLVHLD